MTKILVYRFSAMGDVILLLPVLKGILDENKNVEIYLLTQAAFFPVFQNIDRLHLVTADLKAEHRGPRGLFRLFNRIRKEIHPEIVIDVHCVLRTFILDMFFSVAGYRLILFKKGTFAKRRVVKSKIIKPLPTTVERYSNAFQRAGLKIKLPSGSLFKSNPEFKLPGELFHEPLLVGIAPFARHRQKVWGTTKVENLIKLITTEYRATIILFGGGKDEMKVLNQLSSKYPECVVAANHYTFSEEIQLIQRLALMVSMDSANMHLAAVAGVPTISVWGATHPALGFSPYNQPAGNLVQYEGDRLTCRPCSVFGNKKCVFGDDIRCMELISEEMVFKRIQQILSPDNRS